jgi:hypothetical protein
MARRRSAWASLPESVRRSLESSWRSGVPAHPLALYARWWQLETWLRSLVYVELRARDGASWAAALPSDAEKRETRDRAQGYMASADAQSRLAYLDVAPLFDVLRSNWSLFEDALLDQKVWEGRVVELSKIRNRIGHCRRPHKDDLSRLEQTLRDIDAGAFRAAVAFNNQSTPPKDLRDPVVSGWIAGGHADAQRLIGHADRQYDVAFALRSSRRRWASRRAKGSPVSGEVGYLWHAHWIIRSGYMNIREFWKASYLDDHRDKIVFVCANDPFSIDVSFSAMDDPSSIADAIGNCFDAVLVARSRWQPPERYLHRWSDYNSDIDPRVQVSTTWSIVDDPSVQVTIFGA